MLGLKLPTDPRWANSIEENLEEILVDHAYCEQKAASTAISFIVTYPELSDLVTSMISLAQEEMAHFSMVHKLIIERNMTLGKERVDPYVRKVLDFFPKGDHRMKRLVYRLLVAALIEARSCERFKVLSQKLSDEKLKKFYEKLMISEASHHTLFLGLARKYGDRNDVDKLWNSLLKYEGEIIKEFADSDRVHG
ncbi:MAG: tRNA 2-methylthio-N6-isopentenyl adenosine(37) hydroxylase MiaE [Cryomorphaceae bacterium]|jgi:tRNA-(ms[2]io[6]A)-hydroxylase|nr:tRNA 2-methylthio-N6-isopentenyl adenosine(37) hydroxylase MiaE [Cryomorphaceae bacterium]|tara:strand:- start:9829 stop:10410 length:582 start_codon:yes stop_codon:yes gene_type:complete